MYALVFFHSQVCGHSRRMDSVVDHYLRLRRGMVRSTKVDIEARADLAGRFGVTVAPTLVLLDERMQQVARIEGRCTLPAMRRAFDSWVAADVAAEEPALTG